MTDARDWFTSMAGRRVTGTEIAALLGVSRRTATTRLSEGLSADDLITIARKLGVNPVIALVELGRLDVGEVFSFLEGDGTLLTTASVEQLVNRLAEEVLSLPDRIALGEVAKELVDKRDELRRRRHARRAKTDDDDGTVREWDDSLPYAADSSPDEDEERYERGESLEP